MKCPFCGFNTNKVLDKRETEDFGVARRRRECEKCNKRFTTYERVENLDLVLVKKDGRREKFDRDKLKKGILKGSISWQERGKLKISQGFPILMKSRRIRK